jgi:2-polyprenyl-6-methoxyphenol hydroxylase-like FAD-dependent oxidoreductase
MMPNWPTAYAFILSAFDRDQCETLGKEDWTGRRMVADHFRDRDVFLCGDAAHI